METLRIVRWIAPPALAAASLTLYVRDVQAVVFPGGPTLNVDVGVSGGSGSQCGADSNGNPVMGAGAGFDNNGNQLCAAATSTQYEPYGTAQTSCGGTIVEVESWVIGPLVPSGVPGDPPLPTEYCGSGLQTASNGATCSYGWYLSGGSISCGLSTEVFVTNH
jgi:hypothetical protein